MAPGSMMAFDAFPKTLEDLKERTVGGALISVVASAIILILFISEFRQFRLVETVDQLDVDVNSEGKIAINLDLYLPSLPCSEFVVDLVDESGVQQLHAEENLQKLRMDRHGVPADVPKGVNWGHAVAPAFRHRKMLSLIDQVSNNLYATMNEIQRDVRAEGHDELSHEEHVRHRRALSHRVLQLQERVEELTGSIPEDAIEEVLLYSHQEIQSIRKYIEASRIYSEEQAAHVADNLDSMERNLVSLQQRADPHTAGNLHGALKLRLDVLQDNLKGFVNPEDLERKERYRLMADSLDHLRNSSRLAAMDDDARREMYDAAAEMQEALDELAAGAAGKDREDAERRFSEHLAVIQAELHGGDTPDDYCGPCYGAGGSDECCNSCDDVKEAYRKKRWTLPQETTFEQCKREARRRELTVLEGEGCNLFGSIEVHRASGNLRIAPASSARHTAQGQPIQNAQQMLSWEDVEHFNVSHRINRLSFGDDFPGQVNPLDEVERSSPLGPGIARYFVKVVPTVYRDLKGKTVQSNQFASTEYFKPVRADDRIFQVPIIAISYDITPLRVKLTEKRGLTLVSFLTRCAATLGGVFTVAGMVDKVLYQSQRLLKKLEMGKAI